ncbi:MAG TPA: SRPBCC family protein [bacterium]|nr:SRPBCC family protein [bacterium]
MDTGNAEPAGASLRAGTTTLPSEREIVFTRVFDAPRALVFEAWTDPRHLVHWWGPRGFTLTIHEIAVQPGGMWRFLMHGPDGVDYPNVIVFDEVVPPERLIYSHSGEAEHDSARFQVTVTFAEQGHRTAVTMRMLFPSAAERDHVVKQYGAIEGGNQTLDRLTEYLGAMA